ncbi:MAG TPA: hypothetical protein VGF71_14350 [Caulobacteraceae bacterium]|jgi:hypothetical protein
MRLALSLLAVALLGGCVASPMVDYRSMADRPRKDSWVPYQLTDTTLVIGVFGAPSAAAAGGTPARPGGKAPGAGAAAPGEKGAAAPAPAPPAAPQPPESAAIGGETTLVSPPDGTASDAGPQSPLMQPVSRAELWPIKLNPVTLQCTAEGCVGQSVGAAAVAIPYEGVTLAIEPHQRDFQHTFLAPTYYPNSLRLWTLTLDVKDSREEAVDTLSAVISGAAKASQSMFRSLAPTPLKLPVVIDLADAKKTIAGGEAPLPLNEGVWWYKVAFLDDPDKAGFLKLADRGQVHQAILTSLCRPLQISLTNHSTTLVLGVTVADPDYLLTVPLPAKGQVTLGSLCGADVQMQAVVEKPVDQVVTGFFNAVASTRTAQKPPPKPLVSTTTTTSLPGGGTTTTTTTPH